MNTSTPIDTAVIDPPEVPGPRRSRRRLRVAVATAASVAVVASTSALALTRRGGADASAATSLQSSSVVQGSANGWGSYGGPGSDPWGSGPVGLSSTGGGAVQSATAATAAQSAGLVEISSTLTNGAAAGTGLILTSTGTVVTNHHVVAGATSVKVTVVSTGATYRARYVGGDPTADVAVLRLVGASDLDPVDVASSTAQVGDSVTAVGDANGDGGSLTASAGKVTAEDQDITVQDDDGTSSALSDLIEISAYVVPGDSGGAVLDRAGEVVGMNVAASVGGLEVTGYAIPISTVTSVADQILAGRDTASIDLGYHGYLGVGLDSASTTPLVAGVVGGGAADDVGIAAGDTITSLNGSRISSATELRRLLTALSPGDRATVGWASSDGSAHSATVTLGRAPIA